MSLLDFTYTDDQDDVMAAHVNRLTPSTLRGELGQAVSITTQTALTDGDFPYMKLTPNASLDVLLPPEAGTNHLFVIENGSGTYTLTIKDDSDTTTIGSLSPGTIGIFVPSLGTAWKTISGVEYASSAEVLTGTLTGKVVNPDTLNDVVVRIPRNGYLLNGKIAVSVVSSDLVLAIKTLAGTDPSSSDPVYININGVVRTITAATSCTLADATNWFNLGAAEFAGLEQDLFAYAIWDSNSNMVAVAPARICHGRVVGDFSGTSTNEKYLGNYANYTSTDDVCVIGRFAATLSAGAGYTWTVPTFTAATLVLDPIFETRELNWAPQFTNLTVGNGTLTGKYKFVGRNCFYNWALIFGTTTSVSGSVSYTIPFTRASFYGGSNTPTSGLVSFRDTGTGLSQGITNVGSASANLIVYNASGTYVSNATISSTVPHTWASTDEIMVDDVMYFL